MNIVNTLRNMFHIRTERRVDSPGAMPPVGSSIVLNNLRIKLKYPINIEQWHWFSKQGWRTVDMRTNRRKYICVEDQILEQLLDADKLRREELYKILVLAPNEEGSSLLDEAPRKKNNN